MATQWTGVIAQYVSEQTEGIRHRTNTSSSFELCVAAASRLGRPLTIQCEHTDEEGNSHGARMEVPEELTDTDADVAAAALAATDTTAQAAQEAMWKCGHMVSHTLAKYSGANFFKHGGEVCYHPQCQKALESAGMLNNRGPSRSFTSPQGHLLCPRQGCQPLLMCADLCPPRCLPTRASADYTCGRARGGRGRRATTRQTITCTTGSGSMMRLNSKFHFDWHAWRSRSRSPKIPWKNPSQLPRRPRHIPRPLGSY